MRQAAIILPRQTDSGTYWRKKILETWDLASSPDRTRIGEIAEAPDYAEMEARGLSMVNGLTVTTPLTVALAIYELNEGEHKLIKGISERAIMLTIYRHPEWAESYSDARLQWLWEYWWHRKLWVDPNPRMLPLWWVLKGERPSTLIGLPLQLILNRMRKARLAEDKEE